MLYQICKISTTSFAKAGTFPFEYCELSSHT